MIALVVWCWKFLPCIAVVLVNHRLSGGKHADEEDGDEDHGDGHVDGEDGDEDHGGGDGGGEDGDEDHDGGDVGGENDDEFRKIIISWAANGQLEFIF